MTPKQIKDQEADEAIERLRKAVNDESGFRAQPAAPLDFSNVKDPTVRGLCESLSALLDDWTPEQDVEIVSALMREDER